MDERHLARYARILQHVEGTLDHLRHGLAREGLRHAPSALEEALASVRRAQGALRAKTDDRPTPERQREA